MAGVTVRYRCIDCRRIRTGSPGRRWCDECGGELVVITYQRKRRGARRGR